VIVTVVRWVLEAYVVVLLLRAVLSWFPTRADSPLRPVETVLHRATEPVLAPMRRAVPPVRLGGGYLDLSILIVIIVLEILVRVV
jgi:YggT family protein